MITYETPIGIAGVDTAFLLGFRHVLAVLKAFPIFR